MLIICYCLLSDILDLREMITEAEDGKFPDSPLLDTLSVAIGEAEKCASVATQLITKKVRTRLVLDF